MVVNNLWTIYLLWHSVHCRTYIGITTDIERRIKQHNGILSGGAKATAQFGPGWRVHSTLSGLINRSQAQRWEKILKLRARGLRQREAAFRALGEGICPPNGRQYEVPVNLTYEVY